MKAVIVQTTMVSTKTSNTPDEPLLGGWFDLGDTVRDGALPSPASFERTPRLTPAAIAWLTPAPMNPPAAAAGREGVADDEPEHAGHLT